jgi:hypothetical protein
MATSSIAYGTRAALTMTLAALASDTNLVAGRASTAVDNTTELAVDYILGGKITLNATTPTAARQIEVWVYGQYDGTEYSGGATGTDANLTPDDKSVMKLALIIPTVATAAKAYRWNVGSVAALFGGVVPEKWGVYVVQNTGQALHATAGNHEVYATPVHYTSA